MLTPSHGKRVNLAQVLPIWAADNECFAKSDRFDFGVWLSWLDHMEPARPTCLFAAVPDVVGDAGATLARWEAMAHRVRPTGYPLAFVGQDGQEALPVPWDEMAALFIGGSTDWKLGCHARALVAEAKERGKWVHMGRVNSGKRLLYATRIGCDSADGTYMAFNPSEALSRMGRWLARANAPQMVMPL